MDSSTPVAAPRIDPDQIARYNRTEVAFPDQCTLQQLFEARVRQCPTAAAVICDHDKSFGKPSITYAELNEKANQLAHRLQADGVRPGQVVALMVERSFAMMIGILATLKAGAAYLPISPGDPPDRIRYFLENGSVKMLLVDSKTANQVPDNWNVIEIEDPHVYRGSTTNPTTVAGPRDLAYVIYTSGSTGKPKGVMIEHRSVVNRLTWMQNTYSIGPGDVLLQKTPYWFDVSVWELFWWILNGASLALLMPGGEKTPLAILEAVRKHSVSAIHFVPSMLGVFMDYLEVKCEKVRALGSLRRVFCSGEALLPSHVRRFNRLIGSVTGTRLTNLYGPTEATVDVTCFDCPTDEGVDRVPIGRPIDNTRIHIVEGNDPKNLGETGELCIAGVGLARGYLNNPTLTNERFVEHPCLPGERIYRTGDIGRWLPDGNIEYLGRADQQVKIRGFRIELGEIEETIRTCLGIRDCIVVTKKYSESMILIIAYLVCAEDLEIEKLKTHLRSSLPEYMIPNHFERIPGIPLGSTGKADRKALPEPILR